MALSLGAKLSIGLSALAILAIAAVLLYYYFGPPSNESSSSSGQSGSLGESSTPDTTETITVTDTSNSDANPYIGIYTAVDLEDEPLAFDILGTLNYAWKRNDEWQPSESQESQWGNDAITFYIGQYTNEDSVSQRYAILDTTGNYYVWTDNIVDSGFSISSDPIEVLTDMSFGQSETSSRNLTLTVE